MNTHGGDFLTCITLLLAAPPALGEVQPDFKQLRYEEDFSYLKDPAKKTGDPISLEPLKYITFGQSESTYLTIGGEVRQQFEYYNNPDFGLAPIDEDGYLLQRYMLHGDLHLGPSIRIFGQLKSAIASFQEGPPGPADEDRLDLHQAFFDIRTDLSEGGGEDSLTLRVGRQEMLYGSQRLVSVREGPNVRRSFDAVRVLTKLNDWQVDGFYSRPVETDFGQFDNWGDANERFWGIYGAGLLSDKAGIKLDGYYLGVDRPNATFDQGTADETRHSIGTRLFGEAGSVDYNFEAIYQWGEFGTGDIYAWTAASDTGYTFKKSKWKPRVAIRANVTSGDKNLNDQDLNTFNPLYPRGNYFGEAAILGPLNLIDLHPMVQLNFSETLTLETGWTFYWRQSRDDGIYGPGLNSIQNAAGSNERYVGSEFSLLLEWQMNRHIALSTGYSHFYGGSFLKDTGPGKDVDYFSLHGTYKF
jgi:hypothetical protein